MTPTTTMGGASVLPTDRPLTAGDVKLLSKLMDTLKPFAEVAEKLKHCHVVEICEPTPDNPSRNIIPMPREWFERAGDDLEAIVIQLHSGGVLSGGQASKMMGLDRIEVRKLSDAYRIARPATSAASEVVGDEPWGWNREVCTGCSASLTLEEIKSRGCVSCCPDRRMVKVRDLVDAYEAALASPPSERERELEGALNALDDAAMELKGAFVRNGAYGGRQGAAIRKFHEAIRSARALTAQPAGEGK